MELINGVAIDKNTLVIFDEIQESPEALNALKYFAENKPDIPVICAGSLLGILLHPGHSFPVGKYGDRKRRYYSMAESNS